MERSGSTWREPTHAQGEHVDSMQKDTWQRFKPRTFLLQGNRATICATVQPTSGQGCGKETKGDLDFDLKVLLNCLHCTFRVAVAPPDEKMGRIFLDHIGGSRLFSCANCDTILTNRAELISTRFTGATGRAFLFNK
ncbi:hypothetical protein ATANTOWER_021783, partial [Ataeniobius toweri]|nr:hypothetical protein [Ataeniobius toweri]